MPILSKVLAYRLEVSAVFAVLLVLAVLSQCAHEADSPTPNVRTVDRSVSIVETVTKKSSVSIGRNSYDEATVTVRTISDSSY